MFSHPVYLFLRKFSLQDSRGGSYIVDIATQIGCSERTVRRYLKYPEPPARKTRHKMVKLKPFMD
ncbi:hypothetical protein U9Z28_25825, partial [Escherichia coli]